MSTVPFLTQIDSRAAVRGSRDPLSLVPIWAAFGRRVVGNLTTASTSLRGFTTVLLGYYCADRVLEKGGDESPLNVFMRLEQLASYSRTFENPKDTDYRGSERVRKRLEDSSRVTLCADPQYQILGDQKTYGLWGLYSVASRTSGLLLPDRPSLTPEATEFVERQYVQKLTRAGLRGADALLSAVAPKRKDLDLEKSSRALAHVVAKIHAERPNAEERAVYQRYLVDGGDEQNTDGRQKNFAALLDLVDSEQFEMPDLVRVIRTAERQHQDDLVQRLVSIQRLELLIVAAANLFRFLLRCDGRPFDAVERDIRLSWKGGLKTMKSGLPELVQNDILKVVDAPEAAAYLGQFGRTSASGDWRAAVECLVEFNAFVMKRRGGAPWVRLETGRVKVDYREEGADLASPEDLEHPWANTYFINSLFGIKRELAVR